MNEQHHFPRPQADERSRPGWARVLHNFGDDLRWMCSGWTDFPRPVRRFTAAICTAAGGRLLGTDDAVASIIQTIAE